MRADSLFGGSQSHSFDMDGLDWKFALLDRRCGIDLFSGRRGNKWKEETESKRY